MTLTLPKSRYGFASRAASQNPYIHSKSSGPIATAPSPEFEEAELRKRMYDFVQHRVGHRLHHRMHDRMQHLAQHRVHMEPEILLKIDS